MSVPVRKPTTRVFITVRMSGAEIRDEASGAAVGESGAGGRKGGSEKARQAWAEMTGEPVPLASRRTVDPDDLRGHAHG